MLSHQSLLKSNDTLIRSEVHHGPGDDGVYWTVPSRLARCLVHMPREAVLRSKVFAALF